MDRFTTTQRSSSVGSHDSRVSGGVLLGESLGFVEQPGGNSTVEKLVQVCVRPILCLSRSEQAVTPEDESRRN